MVFAELTWTPELLKQAEDRAHRLGQKGDVTAYYCMAPNTADDIIWKIIGRKLAVVGGALNAGESGGCFFAPSSRPRRRSGAEQPGPATAAGAGDSWEHAAQLLEQHRDRLALEGLHGDEDDEADAGAAAGNPAAGPSHCTTPPKAHPPIHEPCLTPTASSVRRSQGPGSCPAALRGAEGRPLGEVKEEIEVKEEDDADEVVIVGSSTKASRRRHHPPICIDSDSDDAAAGPQTRNTRRKLQFEDTAKEAADRSRWPSTPQQKQPPTRGGHLLQPKAECVDAASGEQQQPAGAGAGSTHHGSTSERGDRDHSNTTQGAEDHGLVAEGAGGQDAPAGNDEGEGDPPPEGPGEGGADEQPDLEDEEPDLEDEEDMGAEGEGGRHDALFQQALAGYLQRYEQREQRTLVNAAEQRGQAGPSAGSSGRGGNVAAGPAAQPTRRAAPARTAAGQPQQQQSPGTCALHTSAVDLLSQEQSSADDEAMPTTKRTRKHGSRVLDDFETEPAAAMQISEAEDDVIPIKRSARTGHKRRAKQICDQI